MNSLVLDCSYGMNVYVVCDKQIFSFEDKTQSRHSDEILNIVDKLLSDAGVSIKEIDNICVCVGPGSFTGVRVAVSVAKGLAMGCLAKIFTLSNFDIFSISEKNFYLVLDGFSNFVYVRQMKDGQLKDYCIEIEKFANEQAVQNLIVYHTTEKTQNLLKKFKISSNIASKEIISAFNTQIKNGANVDLNQIYPVYLRASQAEIEREKKK